MSDNERITYLEKRITQLEQQLNAIGISLAAEKELSRKLETEIKILKEGGNL